MARPREKEQVRIQEILDRLDRYYPEADCALRHSNPFELLVSTILSAQCTDARVNQVTPALFERFPDAQAMGSADPDEIQEMIRSTGFFRNKTKSLIGASRDICARFGGEVPADMERLLQLPGVARKTANVVLGVAFQIADGIVVDTHVKRLAQRLGLTRNQDPVKVEKDLIRKIPRSSWIRLSHQLIHHGRQICKSQKPRCADCFLADLCVFYQKRRV